MSNSKTTTEPELAESSMEKIYAEIESEREKMSVEERLEKAEFSKAEGNKFFKKSDYISAIHHYSCALLYLPDPPASHEARAILYSNRSASRLRMEEIGFAIDDAERATKCDPKYAKGFFRLGAANIAFDKLQPAISNFRRVLQLKPGDAEAKKRLQETQKLFFEREFSKAIADVPTSQSIDISQMTKRVDYDGPELDLTKSYKDGRYDVKFIDKLMIWFKDNYANVDRFPIQYACAILIDVIEILRDLPSLVDVPVPADTSITVCGDTHGQFYDVFTIFKMNGNPSEKNPYLFNGDFVDRGSFSYELIIMYFLYKLVYPNHFHMTRGNHESLSMNTMYGFKSEVLHKANTTVFDLFTEAFNCLPIAYCLGKKVLVLHGGLFEQDGVTLDEIRKIDRYRQPPQEGIMCDALWSDPTPLRLGRSPPPRGCGVLFGSDITEDFCKRNSLKYIVRSHEMKPNGYSIDHNGKCITIFSAPNYCDTMGNKGAFLIFDDKLDYTVKQFYHVSHPNVPSMKYVNPMAM